MAKSKQKKTTYHLFKIEKVDLWLPKGKFDLSSDLKQDDLKYIFEQGYTDLVYKIED